MLHLRPTYPTNLTHLIRTFAGHSKWSNIKHQKGKNDAARSKIVTKALRVLSTALREASGDVTNFKVVQAKSLAARAGCTKTNIDKALKPSKDDSSVWEKIIWECSLSNYCFVVECLSDNRNRTSPLVKHAFTKNGGTMGTTGSVMWAFDERGMVEIVPMSKEETTTAETKKKILDTMFDELFETAVDAGADDVEINYEENSIVVFSETTELSKVTKGVRDAITPKGFEIVQSCFTFIPKDTVEFSLEDESFMSVMDTLDDLDDVQNVYHNGVLVEK